MKVEIQIFVYNLEEPYAYSENTITLDSEHILGGHLNSLLLDMLMPGTRDLVKLIEEKDGT